MMKWWLILGWGGGGAFVMFEGMPMIPRVVASGVVGVTSAGVGGVLTDIGSKVFRNFLHPK